MEFFTTMFTTRWWTCHSWGIIDFILHIFLILPLFTSGIFCSHSVANSEDLDIAGLRIAYNDDGGNKISDGTMSGYYGFNTRVNHYSPVEGRIVKVVTKTNQSEYGCSEIDPKIVPPTGKWIALIKRGECNFNDKIYYSAKKSNASAVVIYDHTHLSKEHSKEHGDESIFVIKSKGSYNVSDVITVFVEYQYGKKLLDYLEDHKLVNMTISFFPKVHKETTPSPNNGDAFAANNTSVLFVSISFIVLIIISLAWLVFYYIQRCRYTNAKERLSRRLANAAKKAIAKIPQRSVKYGDKELESEADQCAVCIEPYKISDVIRVLPCRHVFHKSCVDPWLLEQRSCPMCKMDILRAFGMHLNGSQESVPQDPESGLMSSSPAIEEVERLSNSEEQGAVGGVKIVLYQHPSVHRYRESGSSQFQDSDMSSEGSLDLIGGSPVAQCHVECTSPMVLAGSSGGSSSGSILGGKALSHASQQSLARTVSLDSVHDSDDECNEIHSLISGMPLRSSGTAVNSMGGKSLRKSSAGSSITSSIKDSSEH